MELSKDKIYRIKVTCGHEVRRAYDETFFVVEIGQEFVGQFELEAYDSSLCFWHYGDEADYLYFDPDCITYEEVNYGDVFEEAFL